MAYNIVDMIWIGKLGGAGEVAAVGSAGYFLWLSFSLITLSRVGGVEVIVAQKLGAKEMDEANHYAGTSMTFAVMTGLIYGLILILGRQYLIGFFKLGGDSLVEAQARQYLLIVAFSMPFSLFNQVISAVYNASGQSRLPFRANAFGLVMNMVLDPLMILGLGWGGVAGAAIATTVSQVFVSGMLFKLLFGVTKPYDGFHIEVILRKERLKEMLKIALPVALQNGIFTVLSMFVARIVAGFGTTAIAVQKVGTQIEPYLI